MSFTGEMRIIAHGRSDLTDSYKPIVDLPYTENPGSEWTDPIWHICRATSFGDVSKPPSVIFGLRELLNPVLTTIMR
jgi:hypothetical protein